MSNVIEEVASLASRAAGSPPEALWGRHVTCVLPEAPELRCRGALAPAASGSGRAFLFVRFWDGSRFRWRATGAPVSDPGSRIPEYLVAVAADPSSAAISCHRLMQIDGICFAESSSCVDGPPLSAVPRAQRQPVLLLLPGAARRRNFLWPVLEGNLMTFAGAFPMRGLAGDAGGDRDFLFFGDQPGRRRFAVVSVDLDAQTEDDYDALVGNR